MNSTFVCYIILSIDKSTINCTILAKRDFHNVNISSNLSSDNNLFFVRQACLKFLRMGKVALYCYRYRSLFSKSKYEMFHFVISTTERNLAHNRYSEEMYLHLIINHQTW